MERTPASKTSHHGFEINPSPPFRDSVSTLNILQKLCNTARQGQLQVRNTQGGICFSLLTASSPLEFFWNFRKRPEAATKIALKVRLCFLGIFLGQLSAEVRGHNEAQFFTVKIRALYVSKKTGGIWWLSEF